MSNGIGVDWIENKKTAFLAVLSGEPAGIQTPSLLIRSQMLYSVKLQVQ